VEVLAAGAAREAGLREDAVESGGADELTVDAVAAGGADDDLGGDVVAAGAADEVDDDVELADAAEFAGIGGSAASGCRDSVARVPAVCADSEPFVSGVAAGEGALTGAAAEATAGVLREPRKCQPAAITAIAATPPTAANNGVREETVFSSRSAVESGSTASSLGKRVLVFCLIARSATSCAACASTLRRTHSLGRLGSLVEARR